MNDRPRLLLIDGHSMAFRAFYALPAENFSTSTGQHTNAVYGFTSMLVNLLRDERPTHVGVTFDLSGSTFRSEAYPEYKATRSATPPEFAGQIQLIEQVLDAMGIVHASLAGYEGDDILATWTRQGDELGWESLVVSGDRDAFQLVDSNTTVLYPRKGVSELVWMDPAAIEAKYGVPPQRYPELAALVGETSDNLTGVPGVGPKTAAKWLGTYGGLDELIDQADQIKGKAGQSFREHLDDVRRNRRLNALVSDLPLEIDAEGLARRPVDREAVNELFDTLEFRGLRDRVFAVDGADAPASTDSVTIRPVRLAPDALGDWLAEHARAGAGIEASGHWGAGTGDVSHLALATVSGAAVRLEPGSLSPADDNALAAWLADPGAAKVMHDAKGPMLALAARGLELAGLVSDTQLAAYLLRPDQRRYELDELAGRHLGLSLEAGDDRPEQAQETLDFDGDSGERAEPAAMVRARAVAQLAPVLDEELAKTGQLGLLRDLELPLQKVLAVMERRGIGVDEDVFAELHDEFDAKVQAAQDAAFEAIGREINLGSPKQLQGVLFDQLDMPRTKRTKSGYTTDAAALESLYLKTQHPFLEHLLAHRDSIKLRQIVDALAKSVGDDGRIHTTYLQTVAGTGRLSSTEPNLQNIPIRTSEGRRIRDGFVAAPGYEALLSADYSQIEMRVMADASGDEALIEAFTSGIDFHTVTASHVFGVPAESITPEQRSSVKQMNYGLAYGLSAYGLSSRLGVPVPTAKELMAEYFKTFGAVREYLTDIVVQARKQGYTQTMMGRRRYLPDLNSTSRQRREMAERMALNAPIQGTAADIIKVAMLRVERALAEAGLSSRMLLQIHDELVLEVAPGEREQVQDIVSEAMVHAVELKVPLSVSFGYGRSWNDAAH
ncbi:DNA polymerase I [Propionibacterium australiense]|uniref:DNA polymerase I n=1 Tax=Propionibacterium australiense TaxID=119981 RepID=A0A8B3GGT0_9ACTN|nr:DNA polymerase I [Propionibacterium australiense]RLP11162.1 DNA polymerase I [Propionibacterium australiense]RLP12491.1 DNA polymerase I [Propionibacterium australiense]